MINDLVWDPGRFMADSRKKGYAISVFSGISKKWEQQVPAELAGL